MDTSVNYLQNEENEVVHPYRVAAFYKFVVDHLDLGKLKAEIKNTCQELNILGTILLAPEGINGTVAGSPQNIHKLIHYLQNIPSFFRLDPKFSAAAECPFQKLKVMVKKEIVALKKPHINPAQKTGKLVSPKDWDTLIKDPAVLVLDTRNTYETELGSFQGAVDPKTRHFNEFPNYVENHLDKKQHQKIAMFCTGGIRCEKASAYLLEQGFEEVYQLEGGILKYLEHVESTPQKESAWLGKCFIFDNRITIDEKTLGVSELG